MGGPRWGFPKIRGTLLGVPIIRIIVFWGLYWGPLILGNYQIRRKQDEPQFHVDDHVECKMQMLKRIVFSWARHPPVGILLITGLLGNQ